MDEKEGGLRKKKERVNFINELGKKAKQISTNMLIKLAAEKDGNSSIRKELLLIDRQIKIEQLNTVKDQRKFQAEYNAEKLRHLKELNKKRMEMLEEKRIQTHDDTLHFTPGSSF